MEKTLAKTGPAWKTRKTAFPTFPQPRLRVYYKSKSTTKTKPSYDPVCGKWGQVRSIDKSWDFSGHAISCKLTTLRLPVTKSEISTALKEFVIGFSLLLAGENALDMLQILVLVSPYFPGS